MSQVLSYLKDFFLPKRWKIERFNLSPETFLCIFKLANLQQWSWLEINHSLLFSHLPYRYVDKFTDFLQLFVSVHLRRFESNPQFPVLEFLSLLFKYTFRQVSELDQKSLEWSEKETEFRIPCIFLIINKRRLNHIFLVCFVSSIAIIIFPYLLKYFILPRLDWSLNSPLMALHVWILLLYTAVVVVCFNITSFFVYLHFIISFILWRIFMDPNFLFVCIPSIYQPTNEGYYSCLDIWITFLDYLNNKVESRQLTKEDVTHRWG